MKKPRASVAPIEAIGGKQQHFTKLLGRRNYFAEECLRLVVGRCLVVVGDDVVIVQTSMQQRKLLSYAARLSFWEQYGRHECMMTVSLDADL